MSQTLEAFQKFMDCQLKSSKNKDKPEEQEARPFVTISRESGAGGITIGQKLTHYLNAKDEKSTCPWTLFDQSLVAKVLAEHKLPEMTGKFMPEKKTSEIQDILDTFLELHPPAFALVKKTSETILHLAQMGNAIIVGRGGNIVTQNLPGGVKVRLVGSQGKRVLHEQEYYDLNPAEAAQKVKEDDKGRRDYVKQNFGKNIDDPLLYDLVINTDHISYDDAAIMIGEIVLKRKAVLCKESV